MNPHPSSNAMTPPGRPTLALIARAPASPPLKRVPFFLPPRARSLPLARASSSSSSSFKRTELDRTRPNSTAAPPRRDALDARSSTRPRAATDRDSPLDAPLDARRSIPVNASRRRLASRDSPRVLNHACTRAPARARAPRPVSIAIDESRSMEVDRDRWKSIDGSRRSTKDGLIDRRSSVELVSFHIACVDRVGRSVGLDRSVDRSRSSIGRSIEGESHRSRRRSSARARVSERRGDDGRRRRRRRRRRR